MTITRGRDINVIGHQWFLVDWHGIRHIINHVTNCCWNGFEQWHWKCVRLTRGNTNDDCPLAFLGNAIVGSVQYGSVHVITQVCKFFPEQLQYSRILRGSRLQELWDLFHHYRDGPKRGGKPHHLKNQLPSWVGEPTTQSHLTEGLARWPSMQQGQLSALH